MYFDLTEATSERVTNMKSRDKLVIHQTCASVSFLQFCYYSAFIFLGVIIYVTQGCVDVLNKILLHNAIFIRKSDTLLLIEPEQQKAFLTDYHRSIELVILFVSLNYS